MLGFQAFLQIIISLIYNNFAPFSCKSAPFLEQGCAFCLLAQVQILLSRSIELVGKMFLPFT